MEKIKKVIATYVSPLVSDIFAVSLLLYLASNVLETIKKGIIVDYFNIQNLLLVIIISGVFTVVFPPEKKTLKKTSKWVYWIVVMAVSLLAGYYTWYYTVSSTQYALYFSGMTTMSIAMLAYALQSGEVINEQ